MYAGSKRPIMVMSLALMLLILGTSWAADLTFERFREQLREDIPANQLPTLEMLEDDPDHRFQAKTQGEAQRTCTAYAVDARLNGCTARKITYSTMEGQKVDWNCICH